MLSHEPLVGDHALPAQVRQDLLTHRGCVDGGAARETDLDVKAESLGVEDVVIPAYAIKYGVTRGVVHPVDPALAFRVEAQVEDEHFVPRPRGRVVVQRAHRGEAVEWRTR